MSWMMASCLLTAAAGLDLSAPVMQALQQRCLIVVSINPESRVKAERGPAVAELVGEVPCFVAIKVVNEAGVTAAVSVSGPGLGEAGWLDARFVGSSRLHGMRVEYLLLRLTARDIGKREATFQFDVGQGTQDLGFRAEVPVLFTVREKSGQ